MPLMVGVFALLHLRWRAVSSQRWVWVSWRHMVCVTFLEGEDLQFPCRIRPYEKSNEPMSVGLRLEFWRKSLGFFEKAPLAGHGTGSTRSLFQQAASGRVRAADEVVGNPHNQTLNVAIQ
jgi:O-antigen ligase